MAGWEVYDEGAKLLGATYGKEQVRMVALGLADGGLVVFSPGRRCAEAREALAKWGTPRFLLAPNHFHNAGLAEWAAAYPEARVVAHPRAHARLKKKVPSLERVDGLDGLAAALPPGARVFGPPMAKQGETWLAVERDGLSALVVCDSVVNLPEVALPFWLLGFRAKLMTNPFFKRLFLENKSAYKRWMNDELAAHPPTLFLPCHGGVLRGAEVARELARVTDEA